MCCPSQQTMPFKRTGQIPATRRVGSKAPETAIIFGVADHHQCRIRARIGGGDQCVHHRPANAAALQIGLHRHRADHHHRGTPGIRVHQSDGPALQRANEAAIIKGGKGQVRQRHGPGAQAIGGAAEAVRTKGGIEQRLDSSR